MHPNSDISDLVKRIFNSSWLCLISKECLSLIDNIPAEININVYPVNDWGGGEFSTGVIRTETCKNEAGIIDMLYKNSRITKDMEVNLSKNLIRPDKVYLSTATIAEIMYLNGDLTLLNAVDSVAIHADIGTYLNQISHKRIYEPHYQPPPQADIDAFTKLYNMLDTMSYEYLQAGAGESALAKLTQMSRTTAVGINLEESHKVTLNGRDRSASVSVGLNFPTGRNPFDFSNS